jgi:hypothetical protein
MKPDCPGLHRWLDISLLGDFFLDGLADRVGFEPRDYTVLEGTFEETASITGSLCMFDGWYQRTLWTY